MQTSRSDFLDKKWIMVVDLDSHGPWRFQSVSLSSLEKIGTEDRDSLLLVLLFVSSWRKRMIGVADITTACCVPPITVNDGSM